MEVLADILLLLLGFFLQFVFHHSVDPIVFFVVFFPSTFKIFSVAPYLLTKSLPTLLAEEFQPELHWLVYTSMTGLVSLPLQREALKIF